MSQVDAILEQISHLTPAERIELRVRLIEQDDGPEDANASSAWGSEVRRRLEAFQRGATKAVPGHEVLARMDQVLARSGA